MIVRVPNIPRTPKKTEEEKNVFGKKLIVNCGSTEHNI